MALCEPNSLCGGGHGVCNGEGTFCACNDSNYRDLGDFQRSTECAIHVAAFQTLWSLLAIIWLATALCCLTAFLLMKRKTKALEQSERLQAIVCFFTSAMSSTLSILQVVSLSGSIAVYLPTTILFAVAQIFNWLGLLVKPSTKSESSIARFAMEQTQGVRKFYFALVPVLLIIVFICSAIAVVGAGSPELEEVVVRTFFLLYGAGFGIVTIHIALAMRGARAQLERAMHNSIIVSRRISVKVRMEKFVRHARRVMLMSLVFVFAISLTSTVIGVCSRCWNIVWVVIPLIIWSCVFWITRAMINSIKASLRNRQPVVNKAATDMNSSDKEKVPSGGNRRSGGKKVRSSRKADKKPRKLKKMTIVEEGDYEGTVVATMTESTDAGYGGSVVRLPRPTVTFLQFQEPVEEGEEEGHDGAGEEMFGGEEEEHQDENEEQAEEAPDQNLNSLTKPTL